MVSADSRIPSDPEGRCWDAVIIGTGMGGATLGLALARAGVRVLFLEKGRSLLPGRAALRGDYAERFFPKVEAAQPRHQSILAQAGRWAEEIDDLSHARPRRFIPFLGCGTGGSTALYGMALERLFPSDFTPRRNFSRTNGAALPERWPISYREFEPYYEAAERLFRPCGTPDPLRDQERRYYRSPPPLLPANRELFHFFTARGLHPYRLPIARNHAVPCRGCQGYLCATGCKHDAAEICLAPALDRFGAELLTDCTVLRLEATRRQVTGVICVWRGRRLRLRGRLIVLAAGALATPALLLQSASPDWPRGLANDSDLVGRHLMRHHIDLYVVKTNHPAAQAEDTKEIAFNDLYQGPGQKWGTVQSFGALPPADLLTAGLEPRLRDTAWRWLTPLFRLARPAIQRWLAGQMTGRLVLASILEDLPYRDNRVQLVDRGEGKRLAIRYRIRPTDAARVAAFRRRLASVLQPYRFHLVKQAENNERLAHVCGTCRFGLDPKQSVLDANNRTHALENLYVVDASFFPSSGGTNPGLTIAANALRVAEHLIGARIVSEPSQQAEEHTRDVPV